MLPVKKILNFSTTALATALILLFPGSDSQAGPGRIDNYSLLSAHGGGGGDDLNGAYKASTSAYAAGNCTHCHEQHAGSAPIPLLPGSGMLFDNLALNTFCNYCHGVTPLNGADSISPQMAKTKAHRHTDSLPNTDVLCNDCHQDSHEATTTTHTVGVNNVSGALSNIGKTFGILPTWNYAAPPLPAVGGETMNSPTFSAKDPIDYEYELCLSCHGGQFGVLPDISSQFDPQNISVHPVTTNAVAYKNALIFGAPGTYLKGNWALTNNKKMYCSDCHGSDNATVDPKGPHGSNNAFMLKLTGPGATNLDTLCISCHVAFMPGAQGGGLSGFDDKIGWALPNKAGVLGDHSFLGHQFPANAGGCISCHGGYNGATLVSNIHGANYQWINPIPPAPGTALGLPSSAFLVDPNAANILQLYTDPAVPAVGGSAYCAAACHINTGAGPFLGYRYR